MWVESFLVIIILLLLGWVLFSGSGVFRRRNLLREINSLQDEVQMLREANEALRSSSGVGMKERMKRFEDLFGLVRDLESLRCAIAGSKSCQNTLLQKYNVAPGPELLERIFAAWLAIEPTVKQRLANEMLVGEVGRKIMRSLDSGASIEKAASDAGVPVVIAKGQITRLQILGYLDSRLKSTERGLEALA